MALVDRCRRGRSPGPRPRCGPRPSRRCTRSRSAAGRCHAPAGGRRRRCPHRPRRCRTACSGPAPGRIRRPAPAPPASRRSAVARLVSPWPPGAVRPCSWPASAAATRRRDHSKAASPRQWLFLPGRRATASPPGPALLRPVVDAADVVVRPAEVVGDLVHQHVAAPAGRARRRRGRSTPRGSAGGRARPCRAGSAGASPSARSARCRRRARSARRGPRSPSRRAPRPGRSRRPAPAARRRRAAPPRAAPRRRAGPAARNRRATGPGRGGSAACSGSPRLRIRRQPPGGKGAPSAVQPAEIR